LITSAFCASVAPNASSSASALFFLSSSCSTKVIASSSFNLASKLSLIFLRSSNRFVSTAFSFSIPSAILCSSAAISSSIIFFAASLAAFSSFKAVVICVCSNLCDLNFLVSKLINSPWSLARLSLASIVVLPFSISIACASIKSCFCFISWLPFLHLRLW